MFDATINKSFNHKPSAWHNRKIYEAIRSNLDGVRAKRRLDAKFKLEEERDANEIKTKILFDLVEARGRRKELNGQWLAGYFGIIIILF